MGAANGVAKTPSTRMKHEELLALYASGWTAQELATRFNYRIEYVYQLLREPEYEAMVRGLQAHNISNNLVATREVIKNASHEAIRTVIQIMRTGTTDTVRLKAAETILDRAGFIKSINLNVNDQRPFDEEVASFLARVLDESEREIEPVEMLQDSAGVFRVTEDGEILETSDDVARAYGGYGGKPA